MADCRLFKCLAMAFVIALQVVVKVEAYGITTDCPSFKIGQESTIKCTVVSALVASGCEGTPSSIITFNLGQTSATSCPSAPYKNPAPTCPSESSCGCESETNGTYVYFFKYQGNSAHNGMTFQCLIGCAGGTPATGPPCLINFPATTTAANGGFPVTTTAATGEDKAADVSGNVNMGVIVGASLGGTALLLLILYCCYRQRSPTASPASPGVEMAPVAAAPAVNQLPAQPPPVEADAESAASSAFEESSVAEEESTVG